MQRFGSKVELIEAALDLANARLAERLEAPFDASVTPLRALSSWLADLVSPLAKREALAGSFELLARDVAVEHRRARARVHLGVLRGRISQALVAAGVAARRADELATTVEAQWHGLVIQWGVSGSVELEVHVREGLDGLLALIVPDSSASE